MPDSSNATPITWLDRASRYDFHDVWHVKGSLYEVADVMFDTESLPTWCPAFLSVEVAEPGGFNRIGRVYDVKVKGPLPYSLSLSYRVRERDYPRSFIVDVSGDFEGEGSGSFTQVGSYVRASYRLNVTIRRPLIRFLSAVFKPLLGLQHTWIIWRAGHHVDREIKMRRSMNQEY